MGAEDPGARSLTLGQAAVLAGRYRWVERRLFEVTGSWAPAAPAPAAKVLLDSLSLEHAWHGELWADRLPVLDGADHEALTQPTPTLVELFDALVEPDAGNRPITEGDQLWVARLAGLFRVVLPRLLAGYRRHLSTTTPATDGPTIRALRLVMSDELEAWQAGEVLLEGTVATPAQAAAAAAAQQRLEELLLSGGGGPGLVPWPGPTDGPAGRSDNPSGCTPGGLS